MNRAVPGVHCPPRAVLRRLLPGTTRALRRTSSGLGTVPRGPQIKLKLSGCDRPRHSDTALHARDRYADCVDDPHRGLRRHAGRLATTVLVERHEGGASTVPWVKHTGFCGASGLFQPNAAAATDGTRYERLLSTPFLTWPSPKFQLTTLNFAFATDGGQPRFQRARLR